MRKIFQRVNQSVDQSLNRTCTEGLKMIAPFVNDAYYLTLSRRFQARMAVWSYSLLKGTYGRKSNNNEKTRATLHNATGICS